MSRGEILLNCDLGEGMENDAEIMPYIDQANIACGFHAGDPLQISKTIELAIENNVTIGAHPSYPDRENFGRQSMVLEADELFASLLYQISALDGMAQSRGASVSYVKPHGALYNDMMSNGEIRTTVMRAIGSYHHPLSLMLQATPEWKQHTEEGDAQNVTLQFEAFADRRYLQNGALQPRSEPGSVLEEDEALVQVERLLESGEVDSTDGGLLKLNADTLCVHGDNPSALIAIKAIREILDKR
jgi:5-oxoprolinase (ATP-hydrolysing) subunit A